MCFPVLGVLQLLNGGLVCRKSAALGLSVWHCSWATVVYATPQAATKAIETLNGKDLGGNEVRVQASRERNPDGA